MRIELTTYPLPRATVTHCCTLLRRFAQTNAVRFPKPLKIGPKTNRWNACDCVAVVVRLSASWHEKIVFWLFPSCAYCAQADTSAANQRARVLQMKIHTFAAVAALGLIGSGCASIIDGTSQEITVNTNPSGASCIFYRQGIAIGTIHAPGILNVKRRKYDIEIK